MTYVSLSSLRTQFPNQGVLNWIGLRPAKHQDMVPVSQVIACTELGLHGDRYEGKSGKRHISLIQQEHLPVIETFIGKKLDPRVLRRNLIVSKINLLALKKQYFQIGEAILLGTGNCQPCSKMECALGDGTYNAMRGHGGITAQVIKSGAIYVGATVFVLKDYNDAGLSDLR